MMVDVGTATQLAQGALLRLAMQCHTMHVAAWHGYKEGTQYGTCTCAAVSTCQHKCICTTTAKNHDRPCRLASCRCCQPRLPGSAWLKNPKPEQLQCTCIGCGQGWPGTLGAGKDGAFARSVAEPGTGAQCCSKMMMLKHGSNLKSRSQEAPFWQVGASNATHSTQLSRTSTTQSSKHVGTNRQIR